jgi:hypothetical protein
MHWKWVLLGIVGLAILATMLVGFESAKIITAILAVIFLIVKGSEFVMPFLNKSPYDIK